jgi:hypothetical protein
MSETEYKSAIDPALAFFNDHHVSVIPSGAASRSSSSLGFQDGKDEDDLPDSVSCVGGISSDNVIMPGPPHPGLPINFHKFGRLLNKRIHLTSKFQTDLERFCLVSV